ncbi:hypothetical protein HGO37_04905 [Rhizobium sp. CG4]|uniref:hypothetical protein n=1 Tax=Rhizobium sp. CG4 TaxID=2726075 RepID=UPI0020341E72|nr:hypothetical protein [Rhizobium sp. CG4]MCM2454722.1 hypothetical protein [Rhizobium sp. CG4]
MAKPAYTSPGSNKTFRSFENPKNKKAADRKLPLLEERQFQISSFAISARRWTPSKRSNKRAK